MLAPQIRKLFACIGNLNGPTMILGERAEPSLPCWRFKFNLCDDIYETEMAVRCFGILRSARCEQMSDLLDSNYSCENCL